MHSWLIRIRSLCLALTVLSLCACGHTPVTRTLWDAIPGLGRGVDDIKLNPKLRYLRVTVRGRVALMVLGYVEPSAEGGIDTWYSAEGEVIRLQNGRIVGTAGLETDWRAVRNFSLPAWKDLTGGAERDYSLSPRKDTAGGAAVVYRRERDEMPGYRFGIVQTVSLYPVPVPSNSRLVGVSAAGLRWYEEAVLGQPDGLPSARFGVDAGEPRVTYGEPRVIYGEQCLAQNLCIAWQTWPAAQ